MCHLTWNLELQDARISFFRHVLIRFGIEKKNPTTSLTRQYASLRKSAILIVVQNPLSNRSLCIMPQKLMAALNGKLIYSLGIILKQNVINATWPVL